MKKICLLFLTLPCCFGCSSKMSYPDLLTKLRGNYGQAQIYSNYSSNLYTKVGFFADGSDIVLYNSFEGSNSGGDLYLTLPNATSVPSSFVGLMYWEYYPDSYSDIGKFYVSNSFTAATSIKYSVYSGDSNLRTSGERLAQSSLLLALISLDNFLKKDLNTSLKSIGLFPDVRN